MSSTDRLLRIIAAVVIATLYFTGVLQGTLGIMLLALAAVFAVTAFIRFCPLYTLLGFQSRKKTA